MISCLTNFPIFGYQTRNFIRRGNPLEYFRLPKRHMWACSLKGATKRSEFCSTSLLPRHVRYYFQHYQFGGIKEKTIITQGDRTGNHPVIFKRFCFVKK